jgi:hypothetical protein
MIEALETEESDKEKDENKLDEEKKNNDTNSEYLTNVEDMKKLY